MAAACAALPEVPAELLKDWLPIRKEKRAGPVSDTVARALKREAAEAGLTAAQAVTYCCEAGWQNFNAGHYAKRENATASRPAPAKATKHSGFENKDYRAGVTADGHLT